MTRVSLRILDSRCPRQPSVCLPPTGGGAPGRSPRRHKWIRANYLPTAEAEKKQGLILDFKVFFNTSRRDEKDWDIAYASLCPSHMKALDYSAKDEAKQEIVAPRLAMRV